MYIEIVCHSKKIYEIWHVRSDHKLWNKKYFEGLTEYLRSKYPNDDFFLCQASNSMCDFDLKEQKYSKGDKIFDYGKIEYDLIVQKNNIKD